MGTDSKRRESQPGSSTTLPRFLTTFIGRQAEMAHVRDLILRDDVRLVTLLGTGGAGKTRLAIEIATNLGSVFPDGVWFVPLVSARSGEQVLPAVANALHLPAITGHHIASIVARYLRERRALLILDNFETVPAAAPDVSSLLAACPSLTALVTSRETLRLSGEHVYVVPPLDTPPPAAEMSMDALMGNESVQLFVARAQSAMSGFRLTDDNAESVAGICRRLDGLPLALELAAARITIMSPASLLHLLDNRLAILSSGPRDAPARQRSMHETIGWSYTLLPDEERAVFRRLAVFAGGFSPDAAAAVIEEPGDILGTLASLTAKSLIVPISSPTGEPRFMMLELLRTYGLARLEEHGEVSATRDRHAAWFLNEALASEYAWLRPLAEGAILLARLEMNHANVISALGWLFRSGDSAKALRMAGSLGSLWVVCGHANEGRAWLERLLAIQPQVRDPDRANALATLSWVGNQQGTIEEASRLAQEALAILRSHDVPVLTIRCLVLSALAAMEMGEIELANEQLEEAMERTLALGGPDWWRNWLHVQLVQRGYTALIQNEIDTAEAYFTDAVDRQRARGYEPGISGYHMLAGLGRVARARGDLPQALLLFQQSLDFSRRFPHINVFIVNFSIRAISLIAGAIAGMGQLERAARLFGASDTLQYMYSYQFTEAADLQRAFGIPPRLTGSEESAEPHEASHDTLGEDMTTRSGKRVAPEAIVRAWEEGRSMSLEAAIAEALAVTADPIEATETSLPHRLTPRQLEVLRLVAEGHSNRAIAERLSVSERTVEHHVAHILERLELSSRTAAAMFALREGLL